MKRTLALYVHWPFCKAKCPYCDFNSHVREQVSHAAWQAAYLKELATMAARLSNRTLTSIFFGGGTPSLMAPETVHTIIEAAKRHWPAADDIEITLEANPTSIEAAKMADFKQAGINRASIGIQALNDEALKFLGREHSAKEAIAALESTKKVFDRISFDLIYARPGQGLEDWKKELQQALVFGTSHLSLYQLTIEKGTPFYRLHQEKKFALPDEETAASLYEMTQALTQDTGLYDYEVSNYAKPGYESRHNLSYWQYGEYLGIGPGAHSRLHLKDGTHAVMMLHSPENWLASVDEYSHGIQSDTILSTIETAEEWLMMGLRLKAGIDAETFHSSFPSKTGKLAFLIREELLEPTSLRIQTTPKGRLVLNNLLNYIINSA